MKHSTQTSLKVIGAILFLVLGIAKIIGLILELMESENVGTTAWFVKQAIYAASFITLSLFLWTARKTTMPDDKRN